jgi:hypothetical protein
MKPGRGSAFSLCVCCLVLPWAAATLAGPPAAAWARQPPALELRAGSDPAAEAYQSHRSGVTLVVEGRVLRILADDRSGSRHQRFVLQTFSGHSLLVVHNIDLAPRLLDLQPGEQLTIRGEYVWNPQGGLMHWTHHDPSGRHSPGYIERGGHRYR